MAKVTFEPTFKDKPILTDKKRKLGCNIDILNKTEQLFEEAINKHCKVFFMRMDLRLPSDAITSNDNNAIKNFMNSFVKHLDRNKLDPKYLWCREQSREKHQHYHSFLLLDGSKTRNIHNHIKKAEQLWSKQFNLDEHTNNGLVDDCTTGRNGKQKNGIIINRSKEDFKFQYDNAFKWSTYLAKENTKSNIPKNNNSYASSKLSNKK
ncbi:MAG: inovirus Gp2 family protein [Victivallales bacterium]|nr:inovirus Gp2 family protein [Victivallales bacterium]